jgi:hypothetical protein
VSKLLPTAPTSRREFFQTDVLTAYAEIYDNVASNAVRQIDVLMRLISEDGNAVVVARDALANGAGTGEKPWTTYAYLRQIPLSAVSPGRYLLRVEAQLRGNQETTELAAKETLIQVLNR